LRICAGRGHLAAGDCEHARSLVQEARTALRRAHIASRNADLKQVCDEIDAAERRQMERNAEEQRRQELLNEGDVHLAAAVALVAEAASEAEMAKARALLKQAKDCFERAAAPPQLFEEITAMLQRIEEAETLLRRKAEIEQQRARDVMEGHAKLREALHLLEGGSGVLEAKKALRLAKEALWRAKDKSLCKEVELVEAAVAAAEEHEQELLEEMQRATGLVHRAIEQMGAGGDVDQVQRLLQSAREALAALGREASGHNIKHLQAHLDAAEEQLMAVRVARLGDEYLRKAQDALDVSDLEAAQRAIDAASAAFAKCGAEHPQAVEGLSACRTMQGQLHRVERRLESEKQAAMDEAAGDQALEEAQIIWEDARDAERAAHLFERASMLYKKALNYEKEERVIQAEAKFRAEAEEERRQKEWEDARRAEQLLEAEELVSRARILVESEMLQDARRLLARAEEAYMLAGLGEPTEQLLEVEGYLNFAEEEKRRRDAERAAARKLFKDQGDMSLAKARAVLDSGRNAFDEARQFAKEAGSSFREAAMPEMEDEVLALIQNIADREDLVVKKLLESERLQREQMLIEEQQRREREALVRRKQMEEEAAAAAAEAEARRRCVSVPTLLCAQPKPYTLNPLRVAVLCVVVH